MPALASSMILTLLLQPTRVVQRKGIEHAIELVHRLQRKAKLVISHASGDEGHDYGKSKRDALYPFFAQHLKLDASQVDESKVTVVPHTALETFNAEHPLPDHALEPQTETCPLDLGGRL